MRMLALYSCAMAAEIPSLRDSHRYAADAGIHGATHVCSYVGSQTFRAHALQTPRQASGIAATPAAAAVEKPLCSIHRTHFTGHWQTGERTQTRTQGTSATLTWRGTRLSAVPSSQSRSKPSLTTVGIPFQAKPPHQARPPPTCSGLLVSRYPVSAASLSQAACEHPRRIRSSSRVPMLTSSLTSS
jgi:hypothetical protein